MTAAPSLTVIVPVFNQARELPATLWAVERAVERSPFDAGVIVVDDGSTDGTADAARESGISLELEVIEQVNAGRLAARRAGLAAASGDFVLFVDSRVVIDEDALRFVAGAVVEEPPRRIWNAHVDVLTAGNPYGVFWDVITQAAFATYFSSPRTTSFGSEDFDEFPKGTTCFFGPRVLLEEAFTHGQSRYADERFANDDTVVIRRIAETSRINISPSFRCAYQPRHGLARFIRHAYHRGTVFLDGHGHRGNSLYPVVVAFYPLSAAWLGLATRSRVVGALPLFGAAALGAGLTIRLRRRHDAIPVAALAPVYALAHGAGMWRGLLMLIRDRRSGR